MRPSQLQRRVKLRTQLLVVVLTVVTLVLSATGLVAVGLLKQQLYDRIDRQLTMGPRQLPTTLARPPASLADATRGAPGGLPLVFVATLLDDEGNIVQQLGEDTTKGPALKGLTRSAVERHRETPFSVDAVQGGGQWRVLVRTVDSTSSLAVALPLDEVNDTVQRMLRIIVLVAACGIAVGGALAWLAVRRSLRPLVEVEHAAHAIAAGELSRRVPPAPPRTEVGSLSESFNVMVDRFQSAFQAQQASEVTARESEERMRQFVADASHELRTPLTTVLGYTDLYGHGGVGSQQHLDQVMQRIHREAQRMRLLVEDLLMLARVDELRPLARETVNLHRVCQDAVIDAQSRAHDHVIDLSTTGNTDVEGDEPSLRQIVSNLVTNALTHTPAGTTINVAVRADDQSVILDVGDDGLGMTDEVAARVFERFFRGDPSRTRGDRVGGSGLGLAIVDALVVAHDGHVSLETAPGQGATFTVTFPRRTMNLRRELPREAHHEGHDERRSPRS